MEVNFVIATCNVLLETLESILTNKILVNKSIEVI